MKLKLILLSIFVLIFIPIIIYIYYKFQNKNINFFIMKADDQNSEDLEFAKKILPHFQNTNINKKIKVYHNYEKVKKLDNKYINILFDGEPHYTNNDLNFDLIISTKTNEKNLQNFIYVPFWSMSFATMYTFSVPDLLKKYNFKKEKFCAFMYSNCNKTYDGVSLRENFYDILQQKSGNRVDNLGKCKNLNNIEIDRSIPDWIGNAIDKYKKYKFVIAFENSLKEGYITEKLILPLLAGCVPIYLGAPDVETQFNKKCFISVRDFNSLEECADYVMYVDSNDYLYNTYINEYIITYENLQKYASWYYGTDYFFNKFYLNLPQFKSRPYKKLTNIIYNPEYNIKIINLDICKNRWVNIVKQFINKPHLKYERFSAIVGKNYADNLKNDIEYFHKENRKLSKGEIGIYLSNMEIYSNLVNDKFNNYYLILEDDVTISDDMKDVSFYTENAPKDWDFIFLGVNKNGCKFKKNVHNYVKINDKCMPGGFAFIIRKRAAQFLLNFALPIKAPIDIIFQYYSFNLNMYSYQPEIIKPDYNIALSTTAINEIPKANQC